MDGFKLLEHIGLELDLPVISESGRAAGALGLKSAQAGPARGCSMAHIWLRGWLVGGQQQHEQGSSGSRQQQEGHAGAWCAMQHGTHSKVTAFVAPELWASPCQDAFLSSRPSAEAHLLP